MTIERFSELWKALVTNRAPAAASSDSKENVLTMCNGVSAHTVEALVAAADGDFSHFDTIQPLLAKSSKR